MDPDFDDVVTIGSPDYEGDVMLVTDGERCGIMPKSFKRLPDDVQALVMDLEGEARALMRARESIDELVPVLRDLGVPWGLIGFCTGLTEAACRKRWGGEAS